MKNRKHVTRLLKRFRFVFVLYHLLSSHVSIIHFGSEWKFDIISDFFLPDYVSTKTLECVISKMIKVIQGYVSYFYCSG